MYSDCDSSYEDLPRKTNINILQLDRIRTIALETFKILNYMLPSYSLDLVKFKNTSTVTLSDIKVELPSEHSLTVGNHLGIWNSLPNELRTSMNFED